jgi:hypothetical protein
LLLIAGIMVAEGGHVDSRSDAGRALTLVLVIVLVAEAAGMTTRLVVDLTQGGPETNSAADLLRTGSGVWLYTIVAFALLYWRFDGGGPQTRRFEPHEYPDLAFPEHLSPRVASPDRRRNSSTTCISASLTRPRSAPPMSCHSPAGRSSRWRSRPPSRY